MATAAYIVLDDPGDGGGGLGACPYRAATGLWCPGCGLTRATHHLARGNVMQAMSYNLLAPLVVGAVVLAWWSWFGVTVGRGLPRRLRSFSAGTWVWLAMVVVAFTVVRNLPALTFLRGG